MKLPFPHYVILKASAGAGKTRALTKRYVTLLLSDPSPVKLKAVLAITFSNNATIEMKERVLRWLKDLYFRRREVIEEFSPPERGGKGVNIDLPDETLSRRAGEAIKVILNNYSDFQVRTIDSFMTTIFRASAIDFGYDYDFNILMDHGPLMGYAFDLFLKDAVDGSPKGDILLKVVDLLNEIRGSTSGYLWDPGKEIFERLKDIYSLISSTGREVLIEDHGREKEAFEERLSDRIRKILSLYASSGLTPFKGRNILEELPSILERRDFLSLLRRGTAKLPLRKPKCHHTPEGSKTYRRLSELWNDLNRVLSEYAEYIARTSFMPYVRTYREFSKTLEEVKKREGRVFIGDVNRRLKEFLMVETKSTSSHHTAKSSNASLVPDIYFRLGERIVHFLIDEFQDTSPLQWDNLFPLIENSLAQGGSLFVVGDTKQAIYGFRNADYRIMKELEEDDPFPSARKFVDELRVNHRSHEEILRFNEKVFKEIIPTKKGLIEAARLSGLSDYIQEVRADHKGKGHVEVMIVDREGDERPEREKLEEILRDLIGRGYSPGDIAVLTFTNDRVIEISTWLNEMGLDFISYSNLDVRKRKFTTELLHLLRFLDSPTDDFSFATFLLGEMFSRLLKKEGILEGEIRDFLLTRRDHSPLYRAFERDFPHLWERYFDRLFKLTGYLPLYDLLVEAMDVFRVFEVMQEEEATATRILEIVKIFEGSGYNSVKDFLDFFANDHSIKGAGPGDHSIWDLRVPQGLDAIHVMTIHKAKGLDFPAVVVLFDDLRESGRGYVIEEADEGIRLLKVTKDFAGKSETLRMIRDKRELRELVNYLNTLYVAFTRAEEELYIIGVRGKRHSILEILPVDDFSPSKRPVREGKGERRKREALTIDHYPSSFDLKPPQGKLVHIEGRERGDFVHRVLSSIRYIHMVETKPTSSHHTASGSKDLEAELEGAIERVARETGRFYPMEELKGIVMDLLNHPELGEFFIEKEGRTVLNEEEFADPDGALHRMDRVIVDPEVVTVMDYKTGDFEETHREQILLYMGILRALYPDRDVKGILYYLDRREAMWVRL